MRENLYVDLWEKYRVVINNFLKDGGGVIHIPQAEFEQCGNRDSYSFSLSIENGSIPVKKGSAVARDLKIVLDGSSTFKKYAAGHSVVIRLTADFDLEVRVY